MRFKLNVNGEITCERCQRASFKAIYYELSRCVYVSLNLVAIPHGRAGFLGIRYHSHLKLKCNVTKENL